MLRNAFHLPKFLTGKKSPSRSAKEKRLNEVLCRFLGPNGNLKAGALLLSTVTILLIRYGIGHEVSFEVPVRIINRNPNTVIVDVNPSTIQVTLRGTRESVDKFNSAPLEAVQEFAPALDCNRETDIHIDSIQLTPRSIRGMGNLRFVSANPRQISVTFEHTARLVTTNMVAKPVLVGTPLQGTASVSLPDPLEITFFGSYSQLITFRAKGLLIPTTPIDVDDKTESFKVPVSLRLPSDSGIISYAPSNIVASVEIRTVKSTKPIDISLPEYLPSDTPAPPKAATGTPAAATGAAIGTPGSTNATATPLPPGQPRRTLFPR